MDVQDFFDHDMKIKKGAIINTMFGYYDSFECGGVFIAVKDFVISDLLQEFFNQYEDEDDISDVRFFIDWLKDDGKFLKSVEHIRMFLGREDNLYIDSGIVKGNIRFVDD